MSCVKKGEKMRLRKSFLWTICLLLLLFSTSGCTTLERRTPLEATQYNQQLSSTGFEQIQLVFEETLPKKPLNETVWDNRVGAFWDIEESKQIGFTQDYSKFMPVAATAGVLGGAIGGAVAGLSAGPSLVNTRIVIPFGNIFSKTLESAIAANSKNYSVCYSPNCDTQKDAQDFLKVKIDEFYVWEGPLNHLNLVVKGKSEYLKSGKSIKQHSFENSLLSQKLGTMMSTHASFMQEMNRISNVLAQNVTTDIMSNTFK
jgi:hypothetical protein